MKAFANEHKVTFYTRPDLLADAIFNHITPGIESLNRVVLVVTKPHLRCMQHRLRHADIEPEVLKAAQIVLDRDADECLETFYSAGVLDEARFRQEIGGVLSAAQGAPVYAYGEMVDVLCKLGKFDDAIELECMWNRLARTYTYSLLCGYDTRTINRASANFLRDACRVHSHIDTTGDAADEARFTSPMPAPRTVTSRPSLSPQ